MRLPGLPDEVTKSLLWNLSVDTLDGVVAYSFHKDAWSRSDAWDQMPVLPDNPWRKCHTKKLLGLVQN